MDLNYVLKKKNSLSVRDWWIYPVSVTEPIFWILSIQWAAKFDFVLLFTQVSFLIGGQGEKQQYCVWKLYSVSDFLCYVNHFIVTLLLWFYSDCETFNASIQLFSH